MILLTGATGSAGSFIVNEFVRQRQPVPILVRNRAKAAELEKVPTVEIVEGDILRNISKNLTSRGPICARPVSCKNNQPWTSDGFRSSWRKACRKAGIVGVTFHDLRGTAVTRLPAA
jgi:integrase